MAKQNITLSSDPEILVKARKKAASENTTLNNKFREWLEQYISSSVRADRFLLFMENTKHVETGGKFTRDELNER
jgi:hypothetical protein